MATTVGDAQSIHLETPLPFLSRGFGPGFLHSISEYGLEATFSTPLVQCDPAAALAEFEVQLPGQQSVELQANVSGQQGERAASLEIAPGSPAHANLKNLLTMLRKDQHLEFCANRDVESKDRCTGFSDFHILPKALPELDWDDIDTSRRFLDRTFAAPILITGMTGGITRGAAINENLAAAAVKHNIPMGVGSQRLALEAPEHRSIFDLKSKFPELFLIGNIGAAQLIEGDDPVRLCQDAINMIDADALAIHVNILQELVQVEGDRKFKGITQAIGAVCAAASVPIIVKEVGSGMDLSTASSLFSAGVSVLDVGGRGGTSWSHIEGMRAQSNETKRVAATFRDWGIPTAYALRKIQQRFCEKPLIATGGIRDGLMVAKAVACGATMVGIGLPLMRAALQGPDEPAKALALFKRELKTAMLCSGSGNLAALPKRLRSGFVDYADKDTGRL